MPDLQVLPMNEEDTWKVYFDHQAAAKGATTNNFEDSMQVLGTFNTMSDFWERFSGLMNEKLPQKSNVRVFQSNLRPVWEDPMNRDGGKWIVVTSKQKSVGVFNEVLAAMVGGKFECELSGLVLSKKVREDLVSIWTPSGLPVSALEALRDNISDLLETHLALKAEMTFQWHHDKKNKAVVQGKQGEHKGNDKAAGDHRHPPARTAPSGDHRGKFTGVKPARAKQAAQPGGHVPSESSPLPSRPKSPLLAPREPVQAPPVPDRPSTPEHVPKAQGSWAAIAAGSSGLSAAASTARAPSAPSAPSASSAPSAPASQESEPLPEEKSAPAESSAAGDADGEWQTVGTKPKKSGKRR